MKMNDPIFGELEFNDYFWSRKTIVNFLGKENEITLIIHGDEDGKFDKEQYLAYQSLMENWGQIQHSLLQPILKYYQEKRHELGYDIEFNENYPLVETIDQLIEMISLDVIVVSFGDIFEERDIGLLFNCTWDDENGLGIRLLNEKVFKIGYQDVAI